MFFLKRLREPSTYLGIATVVSGLTFIPHATELSSLIAPAGVVIAGLLGIFLPEAKSSSADAK